MNHYRSQFIHRVTGADFHPRRRVWLLPVVATLLLASVMSLVW